MIRTQIQLKEEQSARLRQIAAAEGVSVAELIRQSIDAYLQTWAEPSYEDMVRRALTVVGKYAGGMADMAENHDRYLAEIYAETGA